MFSLICKVHYFHILRVWKAAWVTYIVGQMTLLCTVYFYSRMSKLVKTGQMRCPISPSAIPETLSGGREPTLESRSLTSPSAVWHACTFTHPTHHNQNSNVQSQYHKLGRKSGIPWNSTGPWGSSYRNSGAKIRFSVLQNQPVFLWILSQSVLLHSCLSVLRQVFLCDSGCP